MSGNDTAQSFLRGAAEDSGRVYQAGRDQKVIENHYNFHIEKEEHPRRRASEGEESAGVDRRGFIQRFGGLASTLVAGGVSRRGSMVRIDPGLIASLGRMRSDLVSSERSLGPTQALPIARHQLETLELMRRETTEKSIGEDILRLEAAWMDLLGWLWQSSGNMRQAGRCAERSIALAIAGRDDILAGYFCSRRSQIAVDCGDARTALGLAERSIRDIGNAGAMRAFGYQQSAMALSLLGEERECLENFAMAQNDLDGDEPPSGDPLSISADFMTGANLDMHKGLALVNLGHLSPGVDAIVESLQAWDDGFNHEKGLHLANLAYGYSLAGDCRTAHSCAKEAFSNALTTGSGRTLRVLSSVAYELLKRDRWNQEFESFALRLQGVHGGLE
ncbi:hypothetical protein ABTZ59_07965 [Streptomyces sp. NPDC094034]|uniref:hypothetical protein n=1 Tax=Streptomyces sp. NPDC094034 TaxID=3155309 RepID=UPI00331FBA82